MSCSPAHSAGPIGVVAMMPSDSADLAQDFVALNTFLYDGGDAAATFRRLVALAVESIPSCEWAALSAWPAGRKPRSLACSAPTADIVDQLQYELRVGPCMTAAVESEVVRIDDIASEERWPAWASATAATTPVRAVLSYHLVDTPVRSALNLYASQSGAFDDDAVTTAALFAAHARVLLMHTASSDAAHQLNKALISSRQIGAAIGILMNAHHATKEQAFELLRVSSQRLNRKLQDIAVDVTDTGQLPGGEGPATTASQR